MMLAAVLASLAAGLLLGMLLGHGMGQNDDARDKADRAAWDDWRTRHLERPRPKPGRGRSKPVAPQTGPPGHDVLLLPEGYLPPPPPGRTYTAWLNYDEAEPQTYATAHRPGYDG